MKLEVNTQLNMADFTCTPLNDGIKRKMIRRYCMDAAIDNETLRSLKVLGKKRYECVKYYEVGIVSNDYKGEMLTVYRTKSRLKRFIVFHILKRITTWNSNGFYLARRTRTVADGL